jgi:UDP:flavonoid glycosyltransferase YjiC (YdhE family)
MGVKKILIVPLNWGLGHTTRLIPVIRELIKFKTEIYFGGSQVQIDLMKREFQSIRFISFPAMQIRLSRQKYQAVSFLVQLPGFIVQIFRENRFLKKCIEKEGIKIVISDNAYGLWNKSAYTIFITHQLTILLPKKLKWMQLPANHFNRWCISKFNECWIPDADGPVNLASRLSHPDQIPENCKYVGILSRFDIFKSEETDISIRKNHVLIILSGPEPQRTIFENMIARQLADLPKEIKLNVVRGLPDELKTPYDGWKNHLPAAELHKLIKESEYIVCRSGYSTIMDLITLNRTALLVPTPGQTEQEYLASYMLEKGWFSTLRQENFKLNDALHILQKGKQQITFETIKASSLIEARLKEIIGIGTS